ncbi:MAG: hypothetical protein E7256_08505 [Lachnospiraceae bacterium]|nr:hypothetical protein [Lachnospiraceae bacterium]
MEEYRKQIIGRMSISAGICILFLIGIMFRIPQYVQTGNEHYSDFMQGFFIGLVILMEVYGITRIVHYGKILGKEDLLKREYYEENDERTRMIYEKAGGNALYGCALAVLVAAIVAGFFEMTVFITLICCSVFLLGTRKVLKIYYGRKF